jgi:transketolase
MRKAFATTLAELAGRDERIVLLTGDLGYMALEPFAERWPERFFNVGVAEQNMVGIATGLAEAGFIPWVYSIVTFATLRPFEFIRNGPIQHQLPVRIVGVGGGVEYGHNGLSHYGLEDIGVLRTQPALTIVAPSDSAQTRSALLQTWDLPGPIYFRLGKDDKAVVDGLEGRFQLGRCQLLGEGGDFLFVTTGNMAQEVVLAARHLEKEGVACTVALVSSLNPAPIGDLTEILSRFKSVSTVESHYITGGLGSLVAEIIAECGLNCRLNRFGVREIPDGRTGSQAYLYEKMGLSASALAKSAMQQLQGGRAA